MLDVKLTRFDGEDYFQAALERNTEALQFHRAGRYVLAMYVAGLSVECILRAFKYRKTETFDERHDLMQLLRASGITELGDDRFRVKIHGAVTLVVLLWRNNYRFCPQSKLRKFVGRIEPRRRIKGDILKYYSKMLYDASNDIITRGAQKWRAYRKK